MKRNRIEAFDSMCITDIKTHNINKLLDKLRAGQEKKLPDNIILDGKQKTRKCTPKKSIKHGDMGHPAQPLQIKK